MVLQPVHEFTPRGRVRGGFASSHAGRPAFLRWLPDSLFHYYLSTAQRSPFLRSWNLAAFTDRIFALSGHLSMAAVRYQSHSRELHRCGMEVLLKLRRPY
jgi:hypothetical protein